MSMIPERQVMINEELRSGEKVRTVQALASLNEMLRSRGADASSLQPLTVLLHDDDVDIRGPATWSVGKLAQNKVAGDFPLGELIALLSDRDAEVRENAAWALGELAGTRVGKEEAIEGLNVLMNDDSPHVRGMAIWALGRMAERMQLARRSSVPRLEALLKDKSLYVSKGAEWTLERIRALESGRSQCGQEPSCPHELKSHIPLQGEAGSGLGAFADRSRNRT